MSTADKLNKLLETKQAIKQAIINKGVEVADDTVFADYPGKIESIMSEGVDPYYEYLWNGATNYNTNYFYLFQSYSGSELDVSGLDTSNAITMMYMFYNCKTLTELDLSNFDTRNVTIMESMFKECTNLTAVNISSFNTSKVTIMDSMFSGCNKLAQLDVSHFDMTNVTDISSMFYGCRALTSLDCSAWDISKITGNYDLGSAFNYCTSLVDFYPPQNINAPMDISGSIALSHDSFVRILNNLMTVTSTKKLTLGSKNLAKLSDDEKQIATSKGWTLA